KQGGDKSDPANKQPVNGQRVEQHMNVFRLAQTAKKAIDHNLPVHWVPSTCADCRASSGKNFFQSENVKCHHSVRIPQNPARCMAKLCLYGHRPISVPDFQSILVTTQSRLRLSQSCGDLRAGESARALRVKRMLDQIVISRVAQLYHDRWVDRLNINERAVSI